MRAAAIALIVSAVAACDAIVGFDHLQKVDDTNKPAPEGGPANSDDDDDDTVLPDGGTSARCDRSQPFGAPNLFDNLDGADSTKRAVMTQNELEIWYLRGDSAPYELRHAVRATKDDDFGSPTTEPLSPGATELGSFAANGLKLYYFTVDSTGTVVSSQVVAARSSAQAAFGVANKLISVSDRPFFVTETDDAAYWAAYTVADDGGTDEFLYRATLSGTRAFDPVLVPGTHEPGALDDTPVLGKNERIIYFTSTRNGGQGAGDIWRAERASAADPFGAPVPMTSLSSPTNDRASWVSDDDCVILLDRSKHIFIAERGSSHSASGP